MPMLWRAAGLLPGSLFYASASRPAVSGRSSLFELAFWQLVNSSHKVGEAVRQWLLGIVRFAQPSPEFR